MSEINYLSINENFPVAGQDNDTQVFRDNFDTIKNSLRISKEEITDIEDNGARLDQNNNFNSNIIENAVFQNTSMLANDRGTPDPSVSTIEIDFTSGSYHIININSNKTFEFTNFPGDPAGTETVENGAGHVILELYSTGGSWTINFVTSAGTIIKKDADFPGTLTVNSTTDPIIVDVWRHPVSNTLFMKYVGQFSE